MGDLFLIILAVILIAAGKGNVVLWVIGGMMTLIVIGSICSRRKAADLDPVPTRIDHPHVWTDEYSECSVCGARFEEHPGVCPECGARFEEITVDEDEFDEEEDEMEDMDEEEGW